MAALREFVKSRTSPALRKAMRGVHTEWQIARLHRQGVKAAARFAGMRPLRLNLGSGYRPKAGWVNVDLGERADVTLDLREPLPFPSNAAAEIYTEHFFEHLSYPNLDEPTAWEVERPGCRSEALTFLRECLRVLQPGGLLDIVVPDAECMLTDYAMRHSQPFLRAPWWGPQWCDTPLHCLNYVFRQGTEHKYAYDEETLGNVLAQAGFTGIRRRPFDPDRDAPNHELASLCMQATKAHA